MSGSHSRFAPSAAKRWLTCHASLTAIESAGLADVASEAAAQGTVAHWLATQENPRAHLGKTVAQEGFSIDIDEEMIEAVEGYNQYCSELGGWQLTEERLSLEPYVPGGFGTSDKIVVVGDTMHVVDLKYGQGVHVGAGQNDQLLLYALGAWTAYGWMCDGVTKVMMHIYQPRIGNISTGGIDVQSLLAEYAAYVSSVAEGIISGSLNNVYVAGPHCKDTFCSLRDTCKAYSQWVMEDFEPMPDLTTLTPGEVTRFLEKAPHVIDWLNGLKDATKAKLLEGGSQPGWKLVSGKGSRKLIASEDDLVPLAEKKGYTKDSLYTKPELLSVAQIESLLGKKNFPAALTQLGEDGQPLLDEEGEPKLKVLWEKIPGAPTLVREDDKRPEYSRSHGFEVVND